MLVRVLGDLEVSVAGRPADLGGPKPRALLSLLVAAAGRPVPVEQLIDQIWGEDPPARVEASLQSYVARLRRALEPERDVRGPAQRLRTHAGGYSLDVAADDVDAHRFTRLVREARAPGSDNRHVDPEALLAEALDLWRGEPYAGADSPSLRAEATRLEELRLAALAELWERRLRRGELGGAVAELEQLVRLHPLDERLWALLARALYGSSRQGDALAAVRRAREHLADELGVDPGPELRRVEESILRHDPELDRPQSAEPRPEPPEPRPETAEPEPFGREEALARVDEALAGAAAGRGRLVLVSGEPGIGKTRLAQAVALRAAGRGFRTGRGGWDAEPGPALWAWSRALRELLGRDVLAEAGGTGTDDGDDAASVSFRQADAVLAALREGPPSLLVLDDLHWADAGSLRLLRRLAAELAGVPVVVLATVRSAPAEIGEPLADALATLARLEPLRLDLTGLEADAVADWATAQAGRDVGAEVAAELVRRTDGNPFYLTELLRLLVREGALGDPAAEAWRTVPGGVRDVVRHRSRQLSAATLAVLETAAVAGRSFDLAVLEALADPEQVAEAVEGALVLGLVEEEAPGRYRFAHALVRDALYETVPGPVRARRHAAVAAGLERVHGGRVAEHATELAEHYRLAGPVHARSGWVFARQAAAAADRAAYDEVLRLTVLADDLQRLDPTTEPAEREEVLVTRARALTRVGRPVEAWDPAATAARSALDRGDGDAAAAALLTVTEAMVWGWRTHPDYDDAGIALWREILEAHPAGATLRRAHLTAALAVEHLSKPGAAAESTRLADEAVAAVRRSGGHGLPELNVLRLAQMALLRPELLHHRMPLADEVVERALRLAHPQSIASALTARAQDRGELGRLAEAHSDVVRAHELAEEHHLSQNLMVSGWCLALRRLLDEDLAATETAIEEGERFQATLAMSGYGLGLCQLGMLRDRQGRLPELEPMLRELRLYHPGIRELHSLAMVRAGRTEDLRALLGDWAEQPDLNRDYLWLFLSALRAETWTALGDTAAARALYDQLGPYAERLAISVAVGFCGSVQLTLGRLATTLGERESAREHLAAARDEHRRLDLPAWVETAERELAAL